MCDGRAASESEWPRCFADANWRGVQLDTFVACRTNLATNRQTRMLADLRTVHCYNMSAVREDERNAALLQSAQHNLEAFAYFGVTEFLSLSQFLFETTFKLPFRTAFAQSNATHSSNKLAQFDAHSRALIVRANTLDSQLYAFAVRLFFARVRFALLNDATFNHERERDAQLRELADALRAARTFEQVRALADSLSGYVPPHRGTDAGCSRWTQQ